MPPTMAKEKPGGSGHDAAVLARLRAMRVLWLWLVDNDHPRLRPVPMPRLPARIASSLGVDTRLERLAADHASFSVHAGICSILLRARRGGAVLSAKGPAPCAWRCNRGCGAGQSKRRG
jgi:hypothetical protein